MSRPRTCPNCQTVIGLEEGYHFASNYAMICDACKKPVVATSHSEEQVIDTSVRVQKLQPQNCLANSVSTVTPGVSYWDRVTGVEALIGPIKKYPPDPKDSAFSARHDYY